MKTCGKCGEMKPVNEFSKRGSEKDGLSRRCKSCNLGLTLPCEIQRSKESTKKRCQKCRESKDIELFDKYRAAKDGRKSMCIECYREAYKSDCRALGKSWFTARDYKIGIGD